MVKLLIHCFYLVDKSGIKSNDENALLIRRLNLKFSIKVFIFNYYK